MARASRSWIAPLLCVALPLLLAQAQQGAPGSRNRAAREGGGDDDRLEGSGPVQSRFDGPKLPPAGLFADAARERCEPFLVARDGGRAWFGCVEHEIGVGDRIAVRQLGPDARPLADARLLLANAAPARIVRPVGALDASGRLVVVWTETGGPGGTAGPGGTGGAARLRLARGDERGFSAPVTLTSGSAPARNVEIARARDGTPWLAWEQWRPSAAGGGSGSFDVVLAPLRGDANEERLGDPLVVGASPASDLDPVIAGMDDGRIAVAWCRFSGRDYEIALRTFDPATGALSPDLNVTADALADDIHPTIAASGADLWIGWDRLEDPSRGLSTPPELRAQAGIARRPPPTSAVRVACVRAGADGGPDASGALVSLPAWPAGETPFESLSGGTPRLVAGAGGRVHLLFRFLARQGPGGRAHGFPLLATVIDAKGVGPLAQIGGSGGAPEEAAACASGDGVIVAWQQDHRLEWNVASLLRPIPAEHAEAIEQLAKLGVIVTGSLAPSGIGVARVERAGEGAAAAAGARGEQLAPPHFHPSGDALDDPFVNGADHFTIISGTSGTSGTSGRAEDPAAPATPRVYRVWWGDLHRHSSVSRCSRGFEPGAADRWTFGRDVNLCDFMALTDHSCHVDALGWWRLDKAGELAASPGFVALAGFEWSTGFHGHQNVILRGSRGEFLAPFLSNTNPDLATPAGLYAALDSGAALAIPHHPADIQQRTDYGKCDPAFVRLVEIYQAQRGSYEFDGAFKQSRQANCPGSFATDAPRSGLKVGFIASTDHGEGASYACALAESLDRAAIFDALRARRTYGATTKGMLVDLRVDGRLMGEEWSPPESQRSSLVTLRAIAAKAIAEIVVFRNGEPWQVLGRAPPDPAGRTELMLSLELAPPAAARAVDWRVIVTAPSGVTLTSGFELPVSARAALEPDAPQWKIDGGRAEITWNRGYASDWSRSFSRLRVAGSRAARVRLETEPGGATELAIGDLKNAQVSGESPLGAWQLSVRELFDAAVDLRRSLGVRELTQEWRDDAPPPGESWYYARVIQTDGEMAWSSPVYVTRR